VPAAPFESAQTPAPAPFSSPAAKAGAELVAEVAAEEPAAVSGEDPEATEVGPAPPGFLAQEDPTGPTADTFIGVPPRSELSEEASAPHARPVTIDMDSVEEVTFESSSLPSPSDEPAPAALSDEPSRDDMPMPADGGAWQHDAHAPLDDRLDSGFDDEVTVKPSLGSWIGMFFELSMFAKLMVMVGLLLLAVVPMVANQALGLGVIIPWVPAVAERPPVVLPVPVDQEVEPEVEAAGMVPVVGDVAEAAAVLGADLNKPIADVIAKEPVLIEPEEDLDAALKEAEAPPLVKPKPKVKAKAKKKAKRKAKKKPKKKSKKKAKKTQSVDALFN